ncbi:MAG TPA: hypothetical protein VFP50_00920, partial [Anaeromyxobacteraceae bacterium]|nr:hypothetical protein [Anaeromyxobacteraceae bacterium]
MTRRRSGGRTGAAAGLPPIYEGPEALDALLERAGSPARADEVAAAFSRALAAGEPRGAVIPTLFPQEPHFASPDEARRLYGNLFGLWARLEAGLGPHDDAPDVAPEPPPPPEPPERGLTPGTQLPADLVEATWKWLAAAPPREVARRRDRFTNAQPDLAAWLDDVALPEAGALAVTDLAFEAWAMFDQAFAERLGALDYRELQALEKEPPPLESVQPALAAYAAEQLDLLSEEDAGLTPEVRAQVERAIATLGAAFTGA